MAFKANTDKAQESHNLKPEGDYEAIISTWEPWATPKGSECINFTYIIRNDIEQKYKNGHIFHSVWKKKEPSPDDMMSDGYNYSQLMAIAAAAGLPKDCDFDSFEDFLNALVGKPIKILLCHEEYEKKIYEKIRRHMPTDFPKIKHTKKQAVVSTSYAAPQNDTVTADADDDYPF